MSDWNICLTFNERFAPHAAALIASILDHREPGRRVVFHVLWHDVSKNVQKQFERMQDDFSFDLRPIELSESLYRDLPAYRGSHATYLRLSIHESIHDVSKILYLDCDTIVNSSLSPLFDVDLGDSYAAVVADSMDWPLSRLESPCFNAGVMLLDNEKLRGLNLRKQAKEIASLLQKRNASFAGQALQNEIFQGKVRFVPFRWNSMVAAPDRGIIEWACYRFFRESHSEDDIAVSLVSPFIVHYLSPRPWDYDLPRYTHPRSNLYWKYLAQTPFYDNVLRRFEKQKELFDSFSNDYCPAGREDLKNSILRCLRNRDVKTIEEHSDPRKKRALFGAGAGGKLGLEYFRYFGRKVDCFIDNNKRDPSLDGIPVFDFDDFLKRSHEYQIVLSTVKVLEILQQLADFGLSDHVRGSLFLDEQFEKNRQFDSFRPIQLQTTI